MKKKLIKWFYHRYLTDIKKLEAEGVKDKWIALTEFVFEIEGKKYFKFPSSSDLPITRVERLNLAMIELLNNLTFDELEKLLKITKTYISEWVTSTVQKKRIENITSAGWAIDEIESRRKELMFHPDALMDVAAITIIREDENPFEINPIIHNEKKELFRQRGGDVDFFTDSGLISLFPKPELLIGKLQPLWEAHVKQIREAALTYGKILGEIENTAIPKD